MKNVLILDNNKELSKIFVKIFEESETLQSYCFLKNEGLALGTIGECCDKGFQLIKDRLDDFDVLVINGYLLNEYHKKTAKPTASLEIIKRIFDENLDMFGKKVYVVIGSRDKVCDITYSEVYRKHSISLLICPENEAVRTSIYCACTFHDEDGKICTRWKKTCYHNPLLAKKCTLEQCLISVFSKAENII